jgi:NAD(P)-dependent dehydrogenase (short-subunit alcohol dehydrogenase family)
MTQHQKSILIIGGTSGLGLACAELAIKDGYKTTIAGRSAFKTPPVTSGRATGLMLDLTHPYSSAIFTPGEQRIGPYDMIIWSAGERNKGKFLELDRASIEHSSRLNVEGPTVVLHQLMRRQHAAVYPCCLVVVASTTSWRTRPDEAVHGMHQAAKAQLARNLGIELPRDIPGSRVLLVNPGGMDTPFWNGCEADRAQLMRPEAVAEILWRSANAFDTGFLELQILREPDGTSKIKNGPRMPA